MDVFRLPDQWRSAFERDLAEKPAQPDPVPERRLARLLAAYIVTGLFFMILPGNLLFAINQIQFVKLRIRAAHTTDRSEKLSTGRRFLIGQMILIALLAVACIGQHFRWYAAVAFLPVLFRGFAWFAARPEALAIQALGKSELVYACIFGVLLVLGMRLP